LGDDIISGKIGLGFFVQGYLTQGYHPLRVIICLLFYETRLKSASFEPLIDFQAFVVGKL